MFTSRPIHASIRFSAARAAAGLLVMRVSATAAMQPPLALLLALLHASVLTRAAHTVAKAEKAHMLQPGNETLRSKPRVWACSRR
jgi:hypothetical protein